uniref:ATPase subunit 8 n=1 Tax=Dicranocephalus sp. TaxID=2931288 RepID=A0A8T9ZYA0_9HEMI|nr:ATPase subunit 8 [Dicranocephalus sp.]
MPQMAPLWWELLFFFTIICFLMMNIIMYFYKQYSMKKLDQKHIKTPQLNWKW